MLVCIFSVKVPNLLMFVRYSGTGNEKPGQRSEEAISGGELQELVYHNINNIAVFVSSLTYK